MRPVDLSRSLAALPTLVVLAALALPATLPAVEVPFGPDFPIDSSINGPMAVAIVDWDQDGRNDVIAAAFDGDQLRRYMNTESGWLELSLGTFVDGASALATGDIDGDGTPDVAFTAAESDTLGVVLNQGGGFVVTVDSTIAYPLGVTLADIDGDGDLDIAATGFGGGVYWYENDDGDGESWTRHTVGTPTGGPRGIAAADLDGDGDLDLIVTDFNSLDWYENRLAFGEAWIGRILDGSFPAGWVVKAGDLDGDGDIDLVGGSINTPRLIWWESSGVPTSGMVRHEISQTAIVDLHLHDLDGDGDLDIAFSTFGAGGTAGWWENRLREPATWVGRTVTDPYASPRGLALGDLDNDGDLDLVVAGGDSDVIDGFENLTVHRSARYDQPPVGPITGGAQIVASRIGDFDGDGDLDLLSYETDQRLYWRNDFASTKSLLQALSVDLNDPRAFVVGDVDGDGDPDVVVATSLGVEWLQNSGTPGVWSRHTVGNQLSVVALWLADINGDGRLDVIGADSNPGNLRWWSQASNGSFFHYSFGTFTEFQDMAVGDVDLDGKVELVIARDDAIAEYHMIAGIAWEQVPVGAAFTTKLALGDLDSDGDLDVVVSNNIGPTNNPLRAFRNNRTSWSGAITTVAALSLTSISAVDVDGDGDLDVVGGSASGQTMVAINRGDGSLGFEIITIPFDARLVEIADLDVDGRLDFVGHRGSSGPLALADVGGQFGVGISPIVPPSIAPGAFGAFAHIDLLHLGRPADSAVRLLELGVSLTDGSGTVFTGQEVQDVLENLSLWRDNGDGVFGPEDTMLAEIDMGSAASGVVQLPVSVMGGEDLFAAPSSSTVPASYRLFVAGEATTFGFHSWSTFMVWVSPSHQETSASDVSGADLRLHLPPSAGQLIQLLTDEIFADGFDSGSTNAWSATVP